MSSPQGNGLGRGFQSRLNRVAENRAPIEAAKPQVELLPDWKAKFKLPVTLVAAVLLGMLAVFIARAARFHVMGGVQTGVNPGFNMIIVAGVAIICAVLILRLLNIKGYASSAAPAVGVFAMIGLMHNFVHAAPGAFELFFSKEWTDDVISYSEPGSIYFGGNYFNVLNSLEDIAGDPEEQELPKVRRGTGLS